MVCGGRVDVSDVSESSWPYMAWWVGCVLGAAARFLRCAFVSAASGTVCATLHFSNPGFEGRDSAYSSVCSGVIV